MTLAFLSSSVSSSEDISSMNLGEYRPPSVSSSGTCTSTAADRRNRSALRVANFTSLSHSVSSGRCSDENSNALDAWRPPSSSSSRRRTTRTFSFSRYASRTKKSPRPDRARALKHSAMSPCRHAPLADERYGSAPSSEKLPSQLNRFLPLLFPGPEPDAVPLSATPTPSLPSPSGNDMVCWHVADVNTNNSTVNERIVRTWLVSIVALVLS